MNKRSKPMDNFQLTVIGLFEQAKTLTDIKNSHATEKDKTKFFNSKLDLVSRYKPEPCTATIDPFNLPPMI
jgi:hypothetical protein